MKRTNNTNTNTNNTNNTNNTTNNTSDFPNKKQNTGTGTGMSSRTSKSKLVKPMKPSVTRVFFEDHLTGYEIPRLTAVAYTHDRVKGVVYYAGALFRQENEDELHAKFGSKKDLKNAMRQTALTRLALKPLIMNMSYETNLVDMHKMIRKAIHLNGVCQKSNPNPKPNQNAHSNNHQ